MKKVYLMNVKPYDDTLKLNVDKKNISYLRVRIQV